MRGQNWKGLALLCLFLGITFVFKQFQGGFVSGFLFYSVLFLVLLEGIFALSAKRSIRVKRRIERDRLLAGEHLHVLIEVRSPWFLPLLWIAIEDRLPEKLKPLTEKNRCWQLAGFRNRMELRYEIPKMPRGEFQFNDISVHVGDLFGFFQRQMTVCLPQTVLVYPDYRGLSSFHSVNEKNTGMHYALNRMAEDIPSVIGIRDYVNGDKLSRIHWKASAKTGQLKTKEFEHHASNDFMLLIDCEKRHYQGQTHLFERAVRYAAGIAKYAISHHFSCGLSAFREKEVGIPLARHPDQIVRIFEQLARLEADSRYPFAEFLLGRRNSLPYGTTALVFTPHLDAEVVKALLQLRLQKIQVELFWVWDHFENWEDFYPALAKEGIRVHLLNQDDLVLLGNGGEYREKIS